MSLLTELFVARDKEAREYDHGSEGRFPGAQLGGLTNLEFETLWAILTDEEWSPEKHELTLIAERGGSFTFRFPEPYVERLKRLKPEEITVAATSWAATDEIS